jgi:DNA-binding LacI/PurR family transcriptional regulator
VSIRIADVAEKAGVCITTVSRVLNNNTQVRESNRQKVLQTIQALGYNPNAAARALSKGTKDTLGVIIRTLNDPYWADLVEKIEQEALERGYLVVLAVVNDRDFSMEKRWAKIFSEGRTDGMILVSPQKEADYIMDLRESNFPVVIVDNNSGNIDMPSVVVDNVEGGRLATAHLLALGHTRIGHLVGRTEYSAARDRMAGYRLAHTEAGLDVRQDLVRYCNYDFGDAQRIAREWLSSSERPTAVFAFDDVMAIAVMNAAQSLRMTIPGDLSVVGFDDGPVCKWLMPPLTSVRQPSQEVAKEAVNIVFRYIQKRPPRQKVLTVSPTLVVRESTGNA